MTHKVKKRQTLKPGKDTNSKVVYAVVATACAVGFIYGAAESWMKFASEPLSSTTTEVEMTEVKLPSVTVCHYDSESLWYSNSNWTLSEALDNMSMDVYGVTQG